MMCKMRFEVLFFFFVFSFKYDYSHLKKEDEMLFFLDIRVASSYSFTFVCYIGHI